MTSLDGLYYRDEMPELGSPLLSPNALLFFLESSLKVVLPLSIIEDRTLAQVRVLNPSPPRWIAFNRPREYSSPHATQSWPFHGVALCRKDNWRPPLTSCRVAHFLADLDYFFEFPLDSSPSLSACVLSILFLYDG